jgi:hypothetical protein
LSEFALNLRTRICSAQRRRSPAAGSRSEERAEAGDGQVQCVVRPATVTRVLPL